jgi:hypothetical protein
MVEYSMNKKRLIGIVDKISADENRTRGCLHTEMDNARIQRTTETDELLITEFEQETNERRQWIIACLILNIHQPAEQFFHLHRTFNEHGEDVFSGSHQ